MRFLFHYLSSAASVALSDNTTETTTMVTTTSGVTPVSVIFTSLQSIFTVELQNPSSTAFMNRSSMIQTEASLTSNGAFCRKHLQDPEATYMKPLSMSVFAVNYTNEISSLKTFLAVFIDNLKKKINSLT